MTVSLFRRALIFLLTLLLVIPAACVTTAATPFPTLVSESVLVISQNSGNTVYEKDADAVRAPASLTKIATTMTALSLCENPDETMVTVPDGLFEEITVVGGSNIALEPGEVLSVTDLLYAAMRPSACDACSVLAYHFGSGNMQRFFDEMNAYAKRVGCTSTTFKNAHGLDQDGHVSTARDISRIIFDALKNEMFREIISDELYTIVSRKEKAHPLSDMSYESTIPLAIPYSSSYYKGLVPIKSGFTLNAQNCLSTMATRGEETFLVICMGAKKGGDGVNYARTDTTALYDWAFENLETRPLLKKGEVVKTIPTEQAQEKQVGLVLQEDLLVTCQKGTSPELNFSLPEKLSPPFSNESVGVLQVRENGQVLVSADLFCSIVPTELEKEGLSVSATPYGEDGKGGISVVLLVFLILLGLALLLFLSLAVTLRPKKRPQSRPMQRPPQRRP